jgi:hypothetical protein
MSAYRGMKQTFGVATERRILKNFSKVTALVADANM